jgi:hypothetical protein
MSEGREQRTVTELLDGVIRGLASTQQAVEDLMAHESTTYAQELRLRNLDVHLSTSASGLLSAWPAETWPGTVREHTSPRGSQETG